MAAGTRRRSYRQSGPLFCRTIKQQTYQSA